MKIRPRVYLSSPHMGKEEIKFVNEAFESNWISPVGPHINAFEEALADYTGVKYCAALSSGTAAIHLALRILGIGAGDEVICSSFTFSGSCNPIAYQGANPVFVDSENETWNMDPVLLKEAIADRLLKTGKVPKAIIIVHLYGMPAKMDVIMEIAKSYSIPVIEDAAEALGSNIKGRRLGSFGDLGILSFNGNKIITTSGGGALLSNNKQLIDKAKFLATQARDPAPHYQHSEIGFNYRLSNVCAGIGRGQMQVLEDRIHARRKNYQFYETQLSQVGGISFLNEPEGYFSNRWLTTVLFNHPVDLEVPKVVRLSLEEENIESRPLWKPMHQQPVFKNAPFYSRGVSENLFLSGLCLPSGSNLSQNELEVTVSIIQEALEPYKLAF